MQTDENDRPLDPPVLKEAEVVWNPFDDVVPREDVQRAKEEKKRWGGRVVASPMHQLHRIKAWMSPHSALALKTRCVLPSWPRLRITSHRYLNSPRLTRRREEEEVLAAKRADAKRSKKNLGLLSFGEEAEEEEEQLEVSLKAGKIRSAHDVLDDKR